MVKAPVTKPDDMSLLSLIHMAEGQNQHLKVTL